MRIDAGLKCWLALVLLLSGNAVLAHGERNQEPFLRMRTAQFYDVHWSSEKIAVNENVVVSGRFRLFEDWPANLPQPDRVFLGNGTPGPVLARVESYINGAPAIQSGRLQLNRDYEFKTVLKGRIPGHHHVHPMVNVEGAGPLLGPGQWLDVTGDHRDFKLSLTTVDGTLVIVDAETLETIRRAVDRLPPDQCEVITMRDLLGWSAAEVCDALDLTDANQRVLLHRARSRVRGALERQYDQGREP